MKMSKRPRQTELMPPDHTSLQRSRLRKRDRVNPERIYAAAWKAANRRQSSINSGYTTIEWIMCPDGQPCPEPVSRRDAAVAASVIQWLGTNVGSAFLLACERKIEEAWRNGSRVRRRSVFAVIDDERKAARDAERRRTRRIKLDEDE